MYVAEQTGPRPRSSTRPGTGGRRSICDGDLSHGNEQGFLGLAFSPDGTKLYVDYTDANGDTQVDEYAMRATTPTRHPPARCSFVDQPYPTTTAARWRSGPTACSTSASATAAARATRTTTARTSATPLGKILRIDPTRVRQRAVHASRPTIRSSGRSGAFAENWMYGLRNPWRFSFDRTTGDVWIGDVGQGAYEEIDYAPRGDTGVNWGWSSARASTSSKVLSPPARA